MRFPSQKLRMVPLISANARSLKNSRVRRLLCAIFAGFNSVRTVNCLLFNFSASSMPLARRLGKKCKEIFYITPLTCRNTWTRLSHKEMQRTVHSPTRGNSKKTPQGDSRVRNGSVHPKCEGCHNVSQNTLALSACYIMWATCSIIWCIFAAIVAWTQNSYSEGSLAQSTEKTTKPFAR